MPAKGYRKENVRDKVLQIRLTEDDLKMAHYLSECFNKSISEYLRDIIKSRYAEEIANGKKVEVIIT